MLEALATGRDNAHPLFGHSFILSKALSARWRWEEPGGKALGSDPTERIRTPSLKHFRADGRSGGVLALGVASGDRVHVGMRILYCDVDTLRADHTSPYGYRRAITPNLEQVAREGVVLDRCYASDSPCAPSRAALTSGQFGITTGAIANFGPAAEIRLFERTRYGPFFGGHLYRNGIYTSSISCFPERHLAYWFLGNFREWSKPSLSNGDDEDAATVTDAAIEWLRRRGRSDNWFLQVHFWDPHIPYFEPASWRDRAAGAGDPPGWPDEDAIAGHAESYGPHTALDLYEGDGSWSVPAPESPNPETMPDSIRNRSDYVKLVNGYDGAIAYWDHHLGRLLNELSALGIDDENRASDDSSRHQAAPSGRKQQLPAKALALLRPINSNACEPKARNLVPRQTALHDSRRAIIGDRRGSQTIEAENGLGVVVNGQKGFCAALVVALARIA